MATEAKKKLNVPITKPSLGEEEARAPFDSIKSGWVTQGPKVAEFEKAVAAYVGAKHGVATTSCTTGLHLALATAGIGPGDEVIVPSFTFIASANAILYTGATAVFCEIDPKTFNIDPNDIEKRITKKTKAIMPIDQIGLSADMDAVNAIAKKHGLDVVEDAAPAIGENVQGEEVGCERAPDRLLVPPAQGHHHRRGRHDHHRRRRVRRRARKLRAHGMSVSDLRPPQVRSRDHRGVPELGFNYRMTDIQASIGLVQLRRLDGCLRIRREKAARYNTELAEVRASRCRSFRSTRATPTSRTACASRRTASSTARTS